MSLYNRTRTIDQEYAFADDNALVNFVKTTYKFFGASLLFAAIGAFIGSQNYGIVMQYFGAIIILEIIAYFGLLFSKNKPVLNVAMLFIYTTLSGVTLVPLLGFVISKSGLSAVWQALAMTTIIFGIMSIFALKTKNDLTKLSKILFYSLIVVIAFILINIFLGSPLLQVLIAGGSAILFSIFVAFHTQNIVRGAYDNPVEAAIGIYLAFLNIFISILQLIGLFGNRND